MTLQQAASRFGASFAPKGGKGGGGATPRRRRPSRRFHPAAGAHGARARCSPCSLQRHMHLYGTTREHFAEVAISTRDNAIRRETSLMQEPLTREDYFGARMISDPLCLYDFCLECDGAVAVVTTTPERAARPAPPAGARHGRPRTAAHGRWGQAITWMGMPDEYFASSGHRPVAQAALRDGRRRSRRRRRRADLRPLHRRWCSCSSRTTASAGSARAATFVADGNIRWPDGGLPVNTHGGNLSEAYIIGMTHVKEAVEQLRGTAVNQVDGRRDRARHRRARVDPRVRPAPPPLSERRR